MRLSPDHVAEALEVALDDRLPLLKTASGEVAGEPAVEVPGSPLGPGQVGSDRPQDYFKAVAHAGQQPLELVVAQINLARQKLADARLVNAAETGQPGLGGARFAHHLAEQVAASRHTRIIAADAIPRRARNQGNRKRISGSLGTP